MLMTQTAVRSLLATGERDPVRFLETLDGILRANIVRMAVDKNLTLALLDYHAGQVRLSGQHESVIVLWSTGAVEVADTLALGFPLGLVETVAEHVHEDRILLTPGDGLVLYSDGITEAANAAGEFYGLERLCEAVRAHRAESAEAIKAAVVADVHAFIGAQTLYDDLTLLVIKQK